MPPRSFKPTSINLKSHIIAVAVAFRIDSSVRSTGSWKIFGKRQLGQGLNTMVSLFSSLAQALSESLLGRWKVLHYTAKDIYEPVIVAPYYNVTTCDLEVWVTSDLWSSTSGSVTFQWYQWDGTPLSNINTPCHVHFTIGALNATRVLAVNTNNMTLDYNNVVLYMNISAQGQLPNTNQVGMFHHKNFFHATPLGQAKLVDPGIKLTYSNSTKNFTVEATTGIAAWTWLDYPKGPVLSFDQNAFLLLPGQPVEVGYTLKSDTTGGEWVNEVTVQSLWNQTLSY